MGSRDKQAEMLQCSLGILFIKLVLINPTHLIHPSTQYATMTLNTRFTPNTGDMVRPQFVEKDPQFHESKTL